MKGRKVERCKRVKGRKSVLAQISVLVVWTLANEKKCSFSKGISPKKGCEEISSPRALAEAQFARGEALRGRDGKEEGGGGFTV